MLVVSCSPDQFHTYEPHKESEVTVAGGTPPYQLAVERAPPGVTVVIDPIDPAAGRFRVTISGITPTPVGDVELRGVDSAQDRGTGTIALVP